MSMNRKEIVDKLYDITWDIESLMDVIKRDISDLDEPAESIKEWKRNVITNLPKNASLKMRLKVEEFLNEINEL